jgi:predicted small secreted protein
MTRLLAIAAILSLGACNTVQGVGRDITNAGRAIENAL